MGALGVPGCLWQLPAHDSSSAHLQLKTELLGSAPPHWLSQQGEENADVNLSLSAVCFESETDPNLSSGASKKMPSPFLVLAWCHGS